MLDLLHSGLSDMQLSQWSLGGLLHETVKHHDAFAYERAEENTRNAFCALQSQFKETVAKRLRVRLAQIRAKRDHAARKQDVSGSKRIRECQDLVLHRVAVVGDREIHGQIVTYMLVAGKWAVKAPFAK